MIEIYPFPAASQGGEPVTLLACLQLIPDVPQGGEQNFLLGPIELSTLEGVAVSYEGGKFVDPHGHEIYTTADDNILTLLDM